MEEGRDRTIRFDRLHRAMDCGFQIFRLHVRALLPASLLATVERTHLAVNPPESSPSCSPVPRSPFGCTFDDNPLASYSPYTSPEYTVANRCADQMPWQSVAVCGQIEIGYQKWTARHSEKF